MRMRSLAVLPVLVLAACGGPSSPAPEIALLTGVHATGHRVTFAFESAPRRVDIRRATTADLVQDGSGRRVRVRGEAFLVVRFAPASGFDLTEPPGHATYDGPARLAAPGAVLEVVRLGDFEAVSSWAIGLDSRRPWHVERTGDTVSIRVG